MKCCLLGETSPSDKGGTEECHSGLLSLVPKAELGTRS